MRGWQSLIGPVRLLLYLAIALVVADLYQSASGIAQRLFNIAILLLFAAVIALLLTPLVDWLQRWGPMRRHRVLAVLVLYVAAASVIAVFLSITIPILAREMASLQRSAPALLIRAQSLAALIEQRLRSAGIDYHLTLANIFSFSGGGTGAAQSALSILGGTIGAVANVLLVLAFSIYLTAEGRELVAALRRLFPDRTEVFDFTVATVAATIPAYMRAQLAMSLLMSVYAGLTLSLIGVHYAVLIGAAVFFLELIPIIGAPIGLGIGVVVALLQSPVTALAAAIVGLGGHALEAYVLGPRISGQATRLHPLVAMIALIVGAELGGILGALFAVPAASAVNVFLGAAYRSQRGARPFPASSAQTGGGLDSLPSLGAEITEPVPRKRSPRAPAKRPPAA